MAFLVSIVVPAHNLWGQTLACLNSIEANTRVPYEIILIDNGGNTETASWMVGWAYSPERRGRAKLFRSQENASYACCCNRGAVQSKGDFLVFLNNDTLVTEGWLERLISVFDRFPDTVIVGPMSNYVAGHQQVPASQLTYSIEGGSEELGAFAQSWASKHAGKTRKVSGVIGFCLAIRRHIWEELGGMDESFVNGYDETDLCFRAIGMGGHIRIARDSFVHHEGSQTFIELGADPKVEGSPYWLQIDQNWETFKSKWEVPKGMGPHDGLLWLIRGLADKPTVYWAVIMERAMLWEAVDALLDVALTAGHLGHNRITVPYTAVDNARNHVERTFCGLSSNKDDVLIMLDADHFHPANITERLAAIPVGVVAALAFRRGPPYDPLFYVRGEDGALGQPVEFERAVHSCQAVGTGAIAIRRWVFDRLEEVGFQKPFFRNAYVEGRYDRPGEDVYFSRLCEEAGVNVHCDTSLVVPHLATTQITQDTWEAFRERHPEIVRDKLEEVLE